MWSCQGLRVPASVARCGRAARLAVLRKQQPRCDDVRALLLGAEVSWLAGMTKVRGCADRCCPRAAPWRVPTGVTDRLTSLAGPGVGHRLQVARHTHHHWHAPTTASSTRVHMHTRTCIVAQSKRDRYSNLCFLVGTLSDRSAPASPTDPAPAATAAPAPAPACALPLASPAPADPTSSSCDGGDRLCPDNRDAADWWGTDGSAGNGAPRGARLDRKRRGCCAPLRSVDEGGGPVGHTDGTGSMRFASGTERAATRRRYASASWCREACARAAPAISRHAHQACSRSHASQHHTQHTHLCGTDGLTGRQHGCGCLLHQCSRCSTCGDNITRERASWAAGRGSWTYHIGVQAASAPRLFVRVA